MIAVNGLGLIALAQGPVAPSSTTSVDTTTIVGQAIILVTTVAGFWYNIYRENRNRRWDKEDRELARNALVETVKEQRVEVVQKVADVAKEVEQKVAAVGDTLVAKADQQHSEVSAAIAENTEKTDQAIKVSQEANHLSRKIAELARAYDKVQGRTTALEELRDDDEQKDGAT